MNSKYSSVSTKHNLTVVKYACSKKPHCSSERLLVSETNDVLWNALVELFMAPERIHSLIAPSIKSDLETLKKDVTAIEKNERSNKEKLDRLLNLYLEGNIPQAGYVVKCSELEAEAERLGKTKSELQYQIQNHGNQNNADLFNTIRILSRSHRRFTEEQKVKVFRSLIRETRITASGIEFQMYVQPTKNVWWKYRQKSAQRKTSGAQSRTVRVDIPQSHRPDNRVYTTGQAAGMLGISSELLRWRIKVGKYPDVPRGNGGRRMF
jgi:hypothetical protein